MAKLTRGLFGPISGKVGNMVFVTRNGKCYVKSLPKRSDKPATEKQIIQRAKFGMVMHFISPLSALINDSYKLIDRKKTGTNVAVKQILTEAISGEYPKLKIDFAKVSLIRGHLATPHATIMQPEGTDQLSFSWQMDKQFNAHSGDELLVLIYCSPLSQFSYNPDLRIRRSEETCSIQIPPVFAGHELHVWLAYRSEDHRSYSCSAYMGEVFIKNRQA